MGRYETQSEKRTLDSDRAPGASQLCRCASTRHTRHLSQVSRAALIVPYINRTDLSLDTSSRACMRAKGIDTVPYYTSQRTRYWPDKLFAQCSHSHAKVFQDGTLHSELQSMHPPSFEAPSIERQSHALRSKRRDSDVETVNPHPDLPCEG